MFVLYEGRESRSAFGEEFPAYFRCEPPRNSPSPVFRRHGQAIDVPAPPVPSTDHRTNNFVSDGCNEERGGLSDQTGKSFD